MMAEAALALVLAAGPSQDPIQKGPKTHRSPVSLYQGRHYVDRHNAKRICVRKRESKHDYRAVSRTGKYRGAYQFSPALAIGAGWMIQRELIATGTPRERARQIGQRLRKHPMNQWRPFWQDMAFWLVWDGGDGRRHWRATVPGTGCFR